jgi:hypothetical protein
MPVLLNAVTDLDSHCAGGSSRPRRVEPVSLGARTVNYNPQWRELFGREADRIRAVLGRGAVQIEHIGSTSVPGLIAKPIIDTCKYELLIDLVEPSHNIDNKNARRIPAEIQEDFKRRNGEPAKSLRSSPARLITSVLAG